MSGVSEPGWHGRRERGSRLGIRALLAVAGLVGRRIARVVLAGVMVYFFLFARSARIASRQWLQLHLDRVRPRDVFRHLYAFATVALDRFFFVRGDLDGLSLSYEGREHLEALKAQGRGAVLLGSHLGSFEAMAAFSRDHDLPVHPVMYTAHARRISSLLERENPRLLERIIEIEPGDPSYVLKLKRCVEQGGFVALLADRAVEGRPVPVEFFGREAWLPGGPYLVAATLGCPIFFCVGIYSEPNRYRLLCEPFAERVELPRETREAALAAHAQRLATRLEELGRAHPFNWFNFFDFWAVPGPAGPPPRRPASAAEAP